MWKRGVGVPTPLNERRRRRTDTAGRALARYPARRMAGGNSTSIRRHCSQPVASAVDLHFGFSHSNGSHTRYVSRLPPPRRPFNFQKPPRNEMRNGDGGAGAEIPQRSNRETRYKAGTRAERALGIHKESSSGTVKRSSRLTVQF